MKKYIFILHTFQEIININRINLISCLQISTLGTDKYKIYKEYTYSDDQLRNFLLSFLHCVPWDYK